MCGDAGYNAEHTLDRTYAEVPKEIVDDMILVDDCSTDATAKVARSLGGTPSCTRRTRLGGNQKDWLQRALRRGADIVVMLHHDYQYSALGRRPHAARRHGHYVVALGSRILGNQALTGGMPSTSTWPTASHGGREPAHRSEAVRIPHGYGSFSAQVLRALRSRELRRLRVRQPDARPGRVLRLPHRRDLLPHALRAGLVVDQLQAQRDLRLWCPRHRHAIASGPPRLDGAALPLGGGTTSRCPR